MLARTRRLAWAAAILVALSAAPTPASAYLVGPPVALEELARSADVVCKATVVADAPARDAWFEPILGYEVREAELRVLSILKGPPDLTVVRFRHYATSAPGKGVGSYTPQRYDFTIGRSYLVLAASATGGTYRQLSKRHTLQEDQGALLAADDKPHRGTTLTQAAWAELIGLLSSTTTKDATYAIAELDAMSGGRDTTLKDFDRRAALDAIRPLTLSPSAAVAAAAITVFGADSPCFDDQQAPFWLAGMGKGAIPGLEARTPKSSPTASLAATELAAVAGSAASPALRALAIRALGSSRLASAAKLPAWSRDPDAAIRSAAVLVSALQRAPGDASFPPLVAGASRDPSADVRRAAALAIGFTQDATLAPTLGVLLHDASSSVRSGAALGLLSFAPDQVETVIKANLGSDFRPLFVNALARKDPGAYLAPLGEIIEKRLAPADWWGGMIPAGDSWAILFGYAKARPPAELTSGKLDASLDSLERMQWYSSSEPRDLYALYVRRGMAARARRFRDATKKSVSYDIGYYFDMVDRSPETYVP
jgi:hypothetical protein